MKRWFLVSVLIALTPMMASSQTVPSNATPQSLNKPVAWPINSYVNLYVDTDSIPEGSRIYNAISSRMQASDNLTGNGVMYSDLTSISGCPDITKCPLAAGPVQIFQAGKLPDGTPSQNYATWSTDVVPGPTQPELSSTVTIDPAQTVTTPGDLDTVSLDYITHITAHETMHDYGLGDAPNQDPNLTIASYGGTPFDPGLLAPSDFDINLSNQFTGLGSAGDPGSGCSDGACVLQP